MQKLKLIMRKLGKLTLFCKIYCHNWFFKHIIKNNILIKYESIFLLKKLARVNIKKIESKKKRKLIRNVMRRGEYEYVYQG